MARVDAATFKTQAAAAAAALTIALSDTVLTEVAADLRDPRHPLRRVEKLFNMDPATGIVTSDDDYIDRAYAGEPENKATPFNKVTDVA